jgi:hypothetical protein
MDIFDHGKLKEKVKYRDFPLTDHEVIRGCKMTGLIG